MSQRATLLVLSLILLCAGCGGRKPVARRPPPSQPPSTTTTPAPKPQPLPPPAVPGQYHEEGIASWYGVPYHGRRAANGEIYDMHKMTAAHRTLPFDTVVRVTNARNGRTTEVRINDRGPFVEGRIIDLSFAAAQAVDMVGAGTAPVRLELLSGPHPLNSQFTVQVGAFLQKENAQRLRERLQQRYQTAFIVEYDSPKGLFYRVRVGRLPNEDAAKSFAERIHREEQITPFVVRLDE